MGQICMKGFFSRASTCIVLFLGCTVVTYVSLCFVGGGSVACPRPAVVSESALASVGGNNSGRDVDSSSVHGHIRDSIGLERVWVAEDDLEAVRRLEAELEFEFMNVTRPRILTPGTFNGDLSSMSRFVMRLMGDPENARKSKEIQNLHAEFFKSEDLRRKREILDRLKVIREDMLAVVNKEIKDENALRRVSAPSSPSSAVPSESPVKTFQ